MTSEITPKKGQWKDAPLVFVLAQLRFLPNGTVSPEQLRDAVVKRVGARFPTINQTSSISIEIALDSAAPIPQRVPVAVYDFVNTGVDAMVRVEQGALTYAVTSYIDSPTFRNEWLDIAASLQDVGITTATRLGLRYVDFIIPSPDNRPQDYVRAPWNLESMPNLPGASGRPDINVSMMDIGYPEGRMRLQFIQGHGVPALPMDLQGMLLPKPPNIQTAKSACGVIDSDRWIDGGNHSTDRTVLDKLFTQMHTDVSSAFLTMLTPLAKGEWNPTNVGGTNE